MEYIAKLDAALEALRPDMIETLQRWIRVPSVRAERSADNAPFGEGVRRALDIIRTITTDPEIGAMYYGRVTRILPIGAKVEIAPGKEGLVHISRLEEGRTEKVEDVVSVGDVIPVMVIKIGEKGIDLSRKDAIAAIKAAKSEE